MSDNEWKVPESWREAVSASKRIRSPDDVRPVRWSCNPDRRWVHLTEDEWIDIKEAFHHLRTRELALSDAVSNVTFFLEQALEQDVHVMRESLEKWLVALDKGRRGEWPPTGDACE